MMIKLFDVYTFFHLINFCRDYYKLVFCTSFLFATICSFLTNNILHVEILEHALVLPISNTLLIVLFLFSFIHKLVRVIFIQAIADGFIVYYDSPHQFSWNDIILFLDFRFTDAELDKSIILTPLIKNKIFFKALKDKPFDYFPFSLDLLIYMKKPENDFFLNYSKIMCEEKNEGGNLKKFGEYVGKRSQRIMPFLESHYLKNTQFFQALVYGFYIGFLFVIFLKSFFL